MVGIIDYGRGNLHSVATALDFLGVPHTISRERDALARADALILPGVGAFPDAYRALCSAGLIEFLKTQKKPMLGICLGMQLLFETGYEDEKCPGLGLIRGEVRRIETAEKLPQIGWNSLELKRESKLTQGLPAEPYVYFVHSFAAHCADTADLVATCDHGATVTAMVERGNVYGCQFHPEKSGDVGLRILKNFTDLVG